jgi:hypothetical protein
LRARSVANAGFFPLSATLAHHLGLKELVETHLNLGAAAGAANADDKLLTFVMSALAGVTVIGDFSLRLNRSVVSSRT